MSATSGPEVTHALLGAELCLRWRGWHQGDFEGPDGEVCAEGALRLALLGQADAEPPWESGKWATFCRARRYLEMAADSEWLTNWNDAPERTAEDVLAAFARARRLIGGAP